MSSQVAEQVSLAVTEVLNEQEVLKEELSAPAVEPLKHNPEVETSNFKVKFAQKKRIYFRQSNEKYSKN